jgi:hypothetical protein
LRLHLSYHIKPINARHPQIQENHVGQMLFDQRKRLSAVISFPDYCHVSLGLQVRNYSLAHNRVIVRYQDADPGLTGHVV